MPPVTMVPMVVMTVMVAMAKREMKPEARTRVIYRRWGHIDRRRHVNGCGLDVHRRRLNVDRCGLHDHWLRDDLLINHRPVHHYWRRLMHNDGGRLHHDLGRLISHYRCRLHVDRRRSVHRSRFEYFRQEQASANSGQDLASGCPFFISRFRAWRG